MSAISRYLQLLDKTGNRFTDADFSPDITRMDYTFLQSFLAWRNWHGFPTMITSAYRGGSSGAHPRGEALDCILFLLGKYRRAAVDPLAHWNLATTWPFLGVGLYFDWSYTDRGNQRVPVAGVHVDIMSDATRRPLRWIRIEGEYYYQDRTTGLFSRNGARERINLYEAIGEFVMKKEDYV